ncbi:hypothetical protein HSX11_14685 [Oxalobacteraceae bacterium]|nr:hypothetical protein [Oxalobacteraceae bacterium]
MSALVVLKLFLVPLLIYAVTMAGRRWGPSAAGWLLALPVVAGSILLAMSIEQGAAFGAEAAAATLLAVIASLAFNLCYAWAAERFGAAGSLCCAVLANLLAVAALRLLVLPLSVALAVVVLALLLAPSLFPEVAQPAAPGNRRGMSDLPWRMLAGTLLVLGVSYGASRMGPRLSGLFAMFPVVSIVLVGFSHRVQGRVFAVTMLRGMVYGYFSFASFCFVLARLLPDQPLATAFLAALACAMLVQLAVRRCVSVARHLRQHAAAASR